MLRVRPWQASDADLLLSWRNDPVTRTWSRNSDPIPEPVHLEWFAAAMEDDGRCGYVIVDDDRAVGHVRFDIDLESSSAEISIVLDPLRTGQGLGRRSLGLAIESFSKEHPGIHRLTATTHADNVRSTRLFVGMGFTADAGHPRSEWQVLIRDAAVRSRHD